MTYLGRTPQSPYLSTHRIAAAIIDLIESSTKRCYLVSPWVRTWGTLDRALEKAASRKVRLTFILRNDQKAPSVGEQLNRSYGAEVILLDDLHAKLYVADKAAIIASMNLYDVSQTRNHELAVLVDSGREVERIRRECLEEDLLAVAPARVFKGWFDAERAAEMSKRDEMAAEFEGKGFCVVCRDRIVLERSPRPYIVRCATCYSKAPDVDDRYFQIRYCHLCGAPHANVLAKAVHDGCRQRIEEFIKLNR